MKGLGLTINFLAPSQVASLSDLPSSMRTTFTVVRAPADGRFIPLNSETSDGLSYKRICSILPEASSSILIVFFLGDIVPVAGLCF